MFSAKVNIMIMITALWILYTAPVTAAAFMTGTDLLSYCKKGNTVDLCTGYIEGVTDTYMRLMKLRGAINEKPCLPNGTKASQIKDSVIQHLENKPADQVYEADDAVLMAIFSSWPACKPGAP